MEDEADERIFLHTAKIIINEIAYVYDSKVLQALRVDHVVRISYELINFEQLNYWTHDAPHVKIIEMRNNGMILGVVLNINRIPLVNNYPLNVGEHVWFKLNNIIEIPINYNGSTNFNSFITKKNVMATGPLYTIESDESCSESEETISDSD